MVANDVYLTEDQKSALTVIAEWLLAKKIPTEWQLVRRYDGSSALMNPINAADDREVQAFIGSLVAADFDAFVACGLFKQQSKTVYLLNKAAIAPFAETDPLLAISLSANQAETDAPVYLNGAKTAILAAPLQSRQFQCDVFMVMPFREDLDPIYTEHIKPLLKNMGLRIKRGDDPFSQHDIITEIWSLINNCQIVIADCTDQNPNVFYEMGLAHAIGKPVIPITQKRADIPFDIRQKRYIAYEHTPRGIKQFEEQLQRAIESILGEP